MLSSLHCVSQTGFNSILLALLLLVSFVAEKIKNNESLHAWLISRQCEHRDWGSMKFSADELVSCGGFYLMIDYHDNQIKSVTNIKIFKLLSCHVLILRELFLSIFPKYFEKNVGQCVFWYTDNSSGPFKTQIQINATLHCLLRSSKKLEQQYDGVTYVY